MEAVGSLTDRLWGKDAAPGSRAIVIVQVMPGRGAGGTVQDASVTKQHVQASSCTSSLPGPAPRPRTRRTSKPKLRASCSVANRPVHDGLIAVDGVEVRLDLSRSTPALGPQLLGAASDAARHQGSHVQLSGAPRVRGALGGRRPPGVMRRRRSCAPGYAGWTSADGGSRMRHRYTPKAMWRTPPTRTPYPTSGAWARALRLRP